MLKAEVLLDICEELGKATIAVELSDGQILYTTGFVVRRDIAYEPVIVIKASKTEVGVKDKKKKVTHTGYLVRCDHRLPKDWKFKVYLYGTKTMWVRTYENGSTRYRKKDGYALPRESWPISRLDLDSIKKI